MSDTATETKTRKAPDERQVSYTIEFVDELPGGEDAGRRSPIEDMLKEVIGNEEAHRRWVMIGKYGKPTAASAAANVLRQKHGRDNSVEGWDFAARKITDKETGDVVHGLFVRYNGDAIVEGAKERHQIAERERAEELEKARLARKNGGNGHQTPRETEDKTTAAAEKKAPRK